MNETLSRVKGTVSVISSDLPFKERHSQFKTVPFKSFTLSPYLIHDLSSLFCLKLTLHSVHQSIYLQFVFAYNGPTNQNNQIWLGESKLHSKLQCVICIISCFVVEQKYDYKYEVWLLLGRSKLLIFSRSTNYEQSEA